MYRIFVLIFTLSIGFFACTESTPESPATQPEPAVNQQTASPKLTNPNDIETDADVLKKALQQNLEVFLAVTDAGEWDKVLDMIYPRVFEVTPRDQLRKSFDLVIKQGIQMKVKKGLITDVSKVVQFGNEKFVHYTYSADLDLVIHDQNFQQKEVIAAMVDQAKVAYGKEKVTYSDANKTISIKANRSVFAISKADQANWKLMEVNPGQEAMVNKLIPASVQSALQ